jgi:glycosyltransferase involved in cell wall biosynthesis
VRILVVCPILPVPPDRGGSIRVFNLIKGLSQTEEVDIISIEFEKTRQHDLAQLANHCRKIFLAPWKKRPKIIQIGTIMGKLFAGEPLVTKLVDSPAFREMLCEVTGEESYDIIIIEHSITAKHMYSLHPQHDANTVLSMHNTAFMQYYRMYRYETNLYNKLKLLLTWLPMRNWEPKIAARFDKVVSVSDTDKKLLLSRNPNLDIAVVPNGVDTKTCRPFPLESREKNILIIGSMDYAPNADAVFYFCNAIFPLIRKSEPDCTLTIVGKDPPIGLLQLNQRRGVIVKADVDDVKPYYQKAIVSAVPLRSGGGTRLKILEAMAFGTPVVSTSIGCEGLSVEGHRNILIADDPADFARCTTDLMADSSLWKRIVYAGRALVEENYDWQTISLRYRDILRQLTLRF